MVMCDHVYMCVSMGIHQCGKFSAGIHQYGKFSVGIHQYGKYECVLLL